MHVLGQAWFSDMAGGPGWRHRLPGAEVQEAEL